MLERRMKNLIEIMEGMFQCGHKSKEYWYIHS